MSRSVKKDTKALSGSERSPILGRRAIVPGMSPQSLISSEVEPVGAHSYFERILAFASRARDVVDRFDPNDDPEAEAIDLSALVVFLVALSISAWMFLRWKVQPMVDAGHHLALSAVVADYGRPGSLYTALYEPPDPLVANSLLYEVAGHFGRLVGVTNAFRLCMTFYVVGLPIATLYALRVFGRSAWPAVLAVPLVYNSTFIEGFANMLFAAPLMILAVPIYYRTLTKRSYGWIGVTAFLFFALFLSHAHMFLWTGVLSFAMTLVALPFLPREGGLVAWGRRSLALVGVALASVAPALLLFARWFARTFGAARTSGGVTVTTVGARDHFGAHFFTLSEALTGLPNELKIYALNSEVDFRQLVYLLLLVGVAVSLARMQRFQRPPVLELCFVVTFVSYFFLPNRITGHDVISGRQPGLALWFLPALLSPVSLRTCKVARFVIIAGICAITSAMLYVWHEKLWAFEKLEVAGLEEVLKAAPPRLRLQYVKLDSTSAIFLRPQFWHVDKFYMSDKFGQVPDNPAILTTAAIHYRAGVDFHRVTATGGFERNPAIWTNFDLVLVRGWHPPPSNEAEARQRGELLVRSNGWELWKSHQASPIGPATGSSP
jgi:hypothetical protein